MTAPPIAVRPALLADLSAVLRIAASCDGLPHWTRAVYRSLLEQQTTAVVRTVLLAEVAGEAVAFGVIATMTGVRPIESEIESLAVDAAWRRRGIGLAVLGALLERAHRCGEGIVRLEVRASNSGAILLYGQAGFLQTGQRSGYYSGPVEDAVLLERTIGPVPDSPATASGIISATYGS